MFLASDNGGPVHPAVMAALARANDGAAPAYGNDPLTEQVRARIRTLFEAPEAVVHLVGTGTAANALILATLAAPWQTVFCTSVAHVHEDECNAPEFFTGGAKLTLVPAPDGRMNAAALRDTIAREGTRGVHGPARGPVTITQATEKGRVHTLDEIRAIATVARDHGLTLHMDGARFANALVTCGCTPAEMTWKAGVDALSFGGTKNGLMGVEGVIFFDPARAAAFEHRRKRGAHLFSKHRYLAAQMDAYLTDGLWLSMAARANAACARLARGLAAAGLTLLWPAEANLLFFRAPRRFHRRLLGAGAVYYLWDGEAEGDPDETLTARLVCDWSTTDDQIDRFLALL